MKISYLSKILGTIVLPCSLAFFISDIPVLAENGYELPTKPLELLAQQDLTKENEKLEKAVKEAQEAIDAAGEAAQVKIDEAVREAEKRLAETKAILEREANWGWLGLLGLIGLLGLAGRGKRSEETMSHQQQVKQHSSN